MASDNDLLIKIQADTKEATKQIDNLTKEVDELTKSTKKSNNNSDKTADDFNKIGKSASNLTTTLKGLAATYLTLSAGKSIITTAADIEEGFLGVAKTTGLTGDALKTLEDDILNLSTKMAGVSVEELQAIAETAGQLGIEGSADILKFTETIAMVGATTELTADEAASGFAKLSNSMGLNVTEVDRLASAINELSNTSTATAGDVVAMSQKMVGVSKEFGLTAEQTLGLSAALTDLGFQADLGGTAISEVMLSMMKNVGGFASASGVAFEEFSTMIKDEPVAALQTFLDSLGDLDSQAKLEVLDELGLKGSGVTQVLLKMSDSTELLTKHMETSTKAFAENKSIQEEFNVSSQGFNANMELLQNTLKVLAVRIGEHLLPKLREMAEKFGEWVNGLDDAKIKQFSEDIAGLIGIFGEVAGAIGSFVSAIGGFITDYPMLSKSLGGLLISLKAIQMVLPLLSVSFLKMGVSATTLGTSATTLTGGIGLLGTAFKTVAGLATPWGLAMSAMAAASTLAFDAYIDGVEKATIASGKISDIINNSTDGTNKLTDAYIKLSNQMNENGEVSRENFSALEQNIKDEIIATEQRIVKMEEIKNKTKEQTELILEQSAKIGDLKAQLDLLPARYSIAIDADTNEAKTAVKILDGEIKRTVSTIKVNADTTKAKKSIDRVKRPTSSIHTVIPKTKDVEKKISKIKQPTDSTHTVHDNTEKVQEDIDGLKSSTQSTHTVNSNVDDIQRDIDNLKKPTQSTHTINEKFVREGMMGSTSQSSWSSNSNSNNSNVSSSSGDRMGGGSLRNNYRGDTTSRHATIGSVDSQIELVASQEYENMIKELNSKIDRLSDATSEDRESISNIENTFNIQVDAECNVDDIVAEIERELRKAM